MLKKIRIIRQCRHPYTRGILNVGDTIEIIEPMANRMVNMGLAEFVQAKGKEKKQDPEYDPTQYQDEKEKDETKTALPKNKRK